MSFVESVVFLVKKGETQRSVSSSSMTVLPLGRAFVTKEERNVVTSHTGVGMSSYYYVGRLEKYQKCLLLMILSDKMDCRRDLIVIVVTNVLYYYSRASVISIIEQRIALFFGLHDGFFCRSLLVVGFFGFSVSVIGYFD